MSENILTATAAAMGGRWKTYTPLLEYIGQPRIFSRDWPKDEVRPSDPYLWITIGDKTDTPVGVLGENGSSTTVQAHGWSWGFTDDEPLEILVALMHAALKSPLVIDGYGPIGLRRETVAILPDPNPEIRHAPMRYRFFTLPVQP